MRGRQDRDGPPRRPATFVLGARTVGHLPSNHGDQPRIRSLDSAARHLDCTVLVSSP